MTIEPVVIGPDDPIGRARDLMLTLGIHALPVVASGSVAGLVTSTDLVDDWPDEDPVSSVMTSVPYTIDAESEVGEAARYMLEQRVHHLLVVRGAATVGILSSLDLLAALLADDE
ncbi:MAG: CBS domain-containing protein [Acidimicrobiales bacterium]